MTGFVRCPGCLVETSHELLATKLHDGWYSEQVMVVCPACSQTFLVACEHAGFNPTRVFDAEDFLRRHHAKADEAKDLKWSWMEYVVRNLEVGNVEFLATWQGWQFEKQINIAYEYVKPIWDKALAKVKRPVRSVSGE